MGIVSDIQIKKSKAGKDYYKIVIEDSINKVIITIWNSKDIDIINIGSIIAIRISNSNFGFAKDRNSTIAILKENK